MNQKRDREKLMGEPAVSNIETRWGGKLFVAVLLAVLAFFWWLLIYSGGAVVRHG